MRADTLRSWLPASVRDRLNAGRFGLDAFMRQAGERVAPDTLVVDIGAGRCPYAPLFSHARYVAVDHAPGLLRGRDGILKVAADMERLPLPDGRAAAVLHTQALEHVPAPARALCEARRILAPGGLLFLSVPLFDPEHEKPHDYWRFTSFGVERLLGEAGFEIESLARRGGYFWVLNKQLRRAHEVLFPPLRSPLRRIVRYPLKVASMVVLEILLPLLFYRLDRRDAIRDYTVGFLAVARNPVTLRAPEAPRSRRAARSQVPAGGLTVTTRNAQENGIVRRGVADSASLATFTSPPRAAPK